MHSLSKIFASIFCALFFVHSASAQEDVGGDWLFTFYTDGIPGEDEPWTLKQNNLNVITGKGGPVNNRRWTVTGTLSLTTVTLYADYEGETYFRNLSGLVGDKNHLSGKWSDNNLTDQDFEATKADFIPDGPGDPNKRQTAVSVLCNRGPSPTDDFICTATVGPKNKTQPPPAGVVGFTSKKGSFRFGETCILVPNKPPQTTSSCGVVLAQAPHKIPAGTVIPISAVYRGSSIDNKSKTGKIPSTTVFKIPKKPKVCFSEQPGACQGLNAIINGEISGDSLGYSTLSNFAPKGQPTQSASPQVEAQASKIVLGQPKKAGEARTLYFYFARFSDNPWLKTPATENEAINGGISLGGVVTTVPFGSSKDVLINVKPVPKAVIQSVHPQTINAFAVVDIRRKGDKGQTRFAKRVFLNVQ